MSEDTSVKTIESYNDDRITLIKNKRKRYNGGSRNVGIEYAMDLDIDYICFLDSDDWWKDNEVLDTINKRLHGHDMLLMDSEMLFPNNRIVKQVNTCDSYEDLYFSINKIWCTAWARVIKKEKIVYFCEDTLMEDRVWSYKQADNVDYNKVTFLHKICYTWNRLNTTNSVSMVRGSYWDASAYCHIGHQLQFLDKMKHTEFKNKLEDRIRACIGKVNVGTYQQY